ncbi:ORC1-type DNA replication protein [Candidatus Woesearchaeota archaeon]|jgi:archaeal cell division control protein 6|nr:ORC1-type DNA replication protein [Candidatus Woesearchaeota archaeon]
MVEENLSEFTKEENIDKIEQIEIKEDKVEVKQDEVKDELNDFFEEFLDKESLFIDKIVLQVKYLPDIILHRTNQMKQLASILAPALKNDKPSNLFIYGKTGTGKTLCMKHTISKMNEISKKRNIPLRIIYLNCKMKKVADTEYRIIAQLAREIGEEVPMTGLPTDEVYNIFINKLESKKQTIIIILDEIDQIVKKSGDEILYTLTRINSELNNAQLTFVGISNDVRFMENIDPRVKSSLGEEELIFPPYNALELKDILERRSALAFKDKVIENGVLQKCAAYAAREHGDARRALDLLRVAGEVAERENCTIVEPKHIDMAEDKIEKSRVLEIIQTQPKQSQIVMYSILHVLDEKKSGEFAETGEVFENYKEVCKRTGNNILTQRRISDLISELDMLGIINAKLISKGRYGRTREIYMTIPMDILEKIRATLESELF